MSTLNIGKGFSLPLELVTSTQAILARKRSGKSYLASVQAEELLDAKQQIVVIDPTGAWHGLKSSADGLRAGYPVVVFGGKHADVPLEPTAGKILAKAVVEQKFSAIFDVSLMDIPPATRFVTDFVNQLFLDNASAMHLFIDEADSYAPERIESKEQTQSLAAIKRLVKQGGIKGIGVTMITQRTAQLANAVLSQVDMITALRTSHPGTIKPITDWIASEVSPEFAAIVKRELPGLPVGTAFISSALWSIGQRVEIRQRRTFNSGATPKPGETKIEPKVLAKVDIERLGLDIQATVLRAQENDPALLRKKIRDLETRLIIPLANTEEVKMLKETIAQLQEEATALEERVGYLEKDRADASKIAKQLYMMLSGETEVDLPKPVKLIQQPPVVVPKETSSTISIPRPILLVSNPEATLDQSGIKVKASARKMLAVLSQWSPAGMTEAQLAARVQMKRTSGTWAAYKSVLKSGGYLEVRDNLWFATQEGIQFIGGEVFDTPTTTAGVVELWAAKLKKGAREMLDVIVARKGRSITRTELADSVGMQFSGTFSAYISSLKQTGLVIIEGSELRANKEVLFL